MSQTYRQTKSESGAQAELPNVIVENCGNFTLQWTCQNYVPNRDLTFTLAPGEKDQFEYDYARRVFGDWKVDPNESPERRIEWNGMIAHTKRKSPSKDGKLPNVKVYDQNGNLLWDAAAQMKDWLEHNAGSRETFAAPGGPVIGAGEMPKILRDASYPELKTLWLKSWGSKMPAGMKAEVAREALMPRMTAEQITEELKQHYSGPAPDMSRYTK